MSMDKEKLDKAQQYVKNESSDLNKIVDSIIYSYSNELDDFIKIVQNCLQMIKNEEIKEYDDETLEMQSLKLPTLLYMAGNGLESLGTDTDIAEYRKKEIYNQIMQSLASSGYTIPDKKAEAEAKTEYESMVQKLYERAYKKLKLKLDYGTKTLESIKKVLDIRIAKINKGKGGDEQNVNRGH